MKTVCEHCGTVAAEGELFCRACGAMLPVRDLSGGAAALRQGRSRPASRPAYGSVAGAAEPAVEYLDDADRAAHALMGRQAIKVNTPRRRTGINWAMVFTILLGLAIFGAAGGYVYLRATPNGQKILARMGYEADTTAMWDIGAEYMDNGYIERAIAIEEDAYQREPNREDIYERLQQLCEAYEMADRTADAERTYTIMYQQVDKTNPVAYQNILRLMRAQNRLMEVAEFLKVAYANTGLSSFETERLDLIPSAPVTAEDAAAGRYKKEMDITLYSPEGNDIYYIIGEEGTLPEDGKLYTEPIHLLEGGHTLRAVCVSTELVSDELNSKYVITYPTPDAPKASLAPGTYQQRQRLRLRKQGEDQDVTIYYTLDGTPPDKEISPVYDENEGILLPGGRVVCRAIAVNKYGKPSNEMSVELQINNVRFENYFYNDYNNRNSDYVANAQLMKTTRDQFVRQFGSPEEEFQVMEEKLRGTCYRLLYTWGEARFYVAEKGTLLYYVSSTTGNLTGPRSTRVGMTEQEITSKYRDMGQKENQDGSRSLYSDSSQQCYGKITLTGDGGKRIEYYYTDKQYENIVALYYYLHDGVCTRIVNSFAVNTMDKKAVSQEEEKNQEKPNDEEPIQ